MTVAGRKSVKALYQKLVERRRPFLERAWDASALTIPTILPRREDREQTAHDDLPKPFQSVGARGVNNLSSKLLLSLFPPNTPFFTMVVDTFALETLAGDPTVKTEVEQNLVKIVQAVSSEIESRQLRPGLFESFRHLVTTGNVLLRVPTKGKLRAHHLDSYVVRRDPEGEPTLLIVRERTDRRLVEEKFARAAQAAGVTPPQLSSDGTQADDETVEIFTVAERRQGGGWELYQEVEEMEVPETRGTFQDGEMPFIVLRMTQISGEDYGRGVVEDYFGDLFSLEGLAQALVEGSAAAARVVKLVDPNGFTHIADLNDAENGDYVPGRAEDVSTEGLDKFGDFQVAANTATELRASLGRAFLLRQAVQRNAERVTAEEIRFVAQELEESLGGVYSSLAQELQLPLIQRIMSIMRAEKRLPALPTRAVKPTIVTGIEALGRGQELNRLLTFVDTAQRALGPQAVEFLDFRELLSRLATATFNDTTGLIKTEEQIQQEQQARQQQEMAASLGPQALRSATELAQNQPQPQPGQQ